MSGVNCSDHASALGLQDDIQIATRCSSAALGAETHICSGVFAAVSGSFGDGAVCLTLVLTAMRTTSKSPIMPIS
jgi:hypothetical protein